MICERLPSSTFLQSVNLLIEGMGVSSRKISRRVQNPYFGTFMYDKAVTLNNIEGHQLGTDLSGWGMGGRLVPPLPPLPDTHEPTRKYGLSNINSAGDKYFYPNHSWQKFESYN